MAFFRNFKSVTKTCYGRGSFGRLGEILEPHRKGGSMIFLVDHYFQDKPEFLARIPALNRQYKQANSGQDACRQDSGDINCRSAGCCHDKCSKSYRTGFSHGHRSNRISHAKAEFMGVPGGIVPLRISSSIRSASGLGANG